MKRLLIAKLLLISGIAHSDGVLDSPKEIGLAVVSGKVVLSKKSKLEILAIRKHRPLGEVKADFKANKKTFEHLDKAYKALLSDINND